MDKALSDAAKHREKLIKENHEMYAKRVEAEKALDALKQQVAKDGSTIDAIKGHVETREKDCVCPVCRMHDRTTSLTQNIEALNAEIAGHKAKIKEQKEVLKGFQGPKSKK
jgi:peptidoglycan hydrolase CwlO-like protein